MKTNFISLFLVTAIIAGCSKDDSKPNPSLTLSVGQSQTVTTTTENISLLLTVVKVIDTRCSKQPGQCSTCFGLPAESTLTARINGSQVADTIVLRRLSCTGAQDLAVGDKNMDVQVVSGVKIGLVNISGDKPDFITKITIIE